MYLNVFKPYRSTMSINITSNNMISKCFPLHLLGSSYLALTPEGNRNNNHQTLAGHVTVSAETLCVCVY